MSIRISIILFFSLLTHVIGAQDQLPIPPSREKTPLFTFTKFERQPALPLFIQEHNQYLQTISRVDWQAKDSFYYAIELGYYEEFEHALTYFNRLKTDTIVHPFTLRIYQLTLTKTERFKTLLTSIANEIQLNPSKELISSFRAQIAHARLANKNGRFDLKNDTLFPVLTDTTLPRKETNLTAFEKKLVPLAKAIDLALREEVKFTDDTDKILAKAYEEFGDFLDRYFYMSNSFIAYSIAHHYDRRNNSISKKRKNIRELLNENNYLYPSFINKFGKIRLDKQNVRIYDEIDSIDLVIAERGRFPELDELLKENNKRPDRLPWLDVELIILVALFVTLILILLLLKTKD